MERLTFNNNYDSAQRLEGIMYSYQGWDSGTVMTDMRSLSLLLFLLERGEIVITEHVFPFDNNIRDDDEIVAVYSALAPQTRWKQSIHTEMAGIRMNALKQMRQVGVPLYDDYICYQEGHINVHCGNIGPSQLLTHLARHPELKSFFIFSYPYWTENHMAKYFRFEFSNRVHSTARSYQEMIWDIVRKKSEANSLYTLRPVPEQRESTE